MIQIEESNPSFESCNKCIYSDDSEETCILRRCIHAVAQLKECYVPKQPTIDFERKRGKWIYLDKDKRFFHPHIVKCSVCNNTLDMYGVNAGRGDANFCPNCGTSWYRVSKDVELKNGKTVKIYRTVFETSDYALSDESVDWCQKAMDRKTEDSE